MKTGVLLFFPEELLPLLLAFSGMAMIFGARKIAASLFLFVVLSIVLPPLLLPLIEVVPVWILWAVLIYLVFLIPFAVVSLFRALVSPALSKGAADQMEGQLARDVAVTMAAAPFKAIFFLVRILWRAFR
ncbi:MAG: hypothetical protein KDI66_20290 [Xanthomonadales bacterium]|nr:hypothetical protein [Xanthomonadales bacterium]